MIIIFDYYLLLCFIILLLPVLHRCLDDEIKMGNDVWPDSNSKNLSSKMCLRRIRNWADFHTDCTHGRHPGRYYDNVGGPTGVDSSSVPLATVWMDTETLCMNSKSNPSRKWCWSRRGTLGQSEAANSRSASQTTVNLRTGFSPQNNLQLTLMGALNLPLTLMGSNFLLTLMADKFVVENWP